MSDIRIAFFDIDGTLIDFHGKQISEKTAEALDRLRKKGVILCLATGRSPLALPRFSKVRFDAFLTFNGSYCFDADQIVFANPIPEADVRRLVANAKSISRPVCVATRDRLAANGSDENLAEYFRIGGLELKIAEDFDALLQEEIYQVMMGCYSPEYPLVMKDIRQAKIAAWWDRAVDIIPANGGKGLGIRKMLEYYHIDPTEAIAFGDGNNDIEMLQAVGTGIAMGNASEELKAAADDICGSVAQDGIYYYCRKHHLID